MFVSCWGISQHEEQKSHFKTIEFDGEHASLLLASIRREKIVSSRNTSGASIFVECGRVQLNQRKSAVDDGYVFYWAAVHRVNIILPYLENPFRMKAKNTDKHPLLRTHGSGKLKSRSHLFRKIRALTFPSRILTFGWIFAPNKHISRQDDDSISQNCLAPQHVPDASSPIWSYWQI